jgi:hypothetical protein
MAQDWKLTRRIMGMLSVRLREVPLESVADPRDERGTNWRLTALLNGMLLGLMAGCKNLAEVEVLTDELSPVVRRRLKIPRRIPDTTMRDLVTCIEPEDICQLIRVTGQTAKRRKATEPIGLPLDVAALDGKATAVEELDNQYAQTHRDQGGLGACGLVRTITCTLVSCAARVLMEVVPMGSKGNEVGFFKTAYQRLLKNHCKSFDVVTYDAGAYSAANAKLVVESGKHYLFGLKDKRKHMRQKAERVLGKSTNVQASTEDVLSKKDNVRVVRRLFLAEAPKGYQSIKSVRTILRVQSHKVDGAGNILVGEDRYFISSLPYNRLSPNEWLELVRRHWAVETCHNILDVAFQEDDWPWITHSAQGMLVVLLLRRLAFNLLTLFRSATQRSDEKRRTPWKTLFRWIAKALEQATEAQVQGLRIREGQPVLA